MANPINIFCNMWTLTLSTSSIRHTHWDHLNLQQRNFRRGVARCQDICVSSFERTTFRDSVFSVVEKQA
jgi:hypothetical protein